MQDFRSMFLLVISKHVLRPIESSSFLKISGVICATDDDAFRPLEKDRAAQKLPTEFFVGEPLSGWDQVFQITCSRARPTCAQKIVHSPDSHTSERRQHAIRGALPGEHRLICIRNTRSTQVIAVETKISAKQHDPAVGITA